MNLANFHLILLQIYECIKEAFAGPPVYGSHSSSVQKTLYEAEKMVLEKIPQVL